MPTLFARAQAPAPTENHWLAPSGPSVPIPPPPVVAATRPWAPGVDGLTVRRHIRRSTVDGAPLLWIVGAHGPGRASLVSVMQGHPGRSTSTPRER